MVSDMNNSGAEFLGKVLGVIGFFVIMGLFSGAFGNDESTCIKPGCDNVQASGSSYCYWHKPSSYRSSYGTSSESTYNSDSTSSYSSRSSSNSTGKYSSKTDHSTGYRSEMYDYDNADDYAEDYAEDYAIDEFGDVDSEEAYEYGYDEAYDDWEDEMDD